MDVPNSVFYGADGDRLRFSDCLGARFLRQSATVRELWQEWDTAFLDVTHKSRRVIWKNEKTYPSCGTPSIRAEIMESSFLFLAG